MDGMEEKWHKFKNTILKSIVEICGKTKIINGRMKKKMVNTRMLEDCGKYTERNRSYG